ncbi:MAG TPA: Maf family protein, partial [Paracoccaceae bacterium]|nr:Maf family protein [Paracoccaceae bacterium]
AVETALGDVPPPAVALALARAKALAVNAGDRLVLGSDSLVVVAGRRFDQPASLADAADHLRFFSGKTMELHSAAALAQSGAIVWSHAALATLKVRVLSEEFITAYLAGEWPEVSWCVGVFRMEAMGVQLFDAVDGDHFTVLGMPLLPVLGALRALGELRA